MNLLETRCESQSLAIPRKRDSRIRTRASSQTLDVCGLQPLGLNRQLEDVCRASEAPLEIKRIARRGPGKIRVALLITNFTFRRKTPRVLFEPQGAISSFTSGPPAMGTIQKLGLGEESPTQISNSLSVRMPGSRQCGKFLSLEEFRF